MGSRKKNTFESTWEFEPSAEDRPHQLQGQAHFVH